MSQPNTNGMRSLSAVVLTWGFAFLPANLIPTIIARLVNDFDMSVGFAGALATTMTLVNSATVLLVRPWVRRHSRAPVAAMGIVVLIAVAATGMAIPSATAFTLLLIIAGLGSGLVLGAASASTSSMYDPDRSANIAMIFNRLMVALAFFTVPLIGGSMTAILLVLAVPGVLVLLTVRWLPQPPAEPVDNEATTPSLPNRSTPIGALAWLLAISFGAWSITDDGVVGIAELIALGRFGAEGSTLFLNMYAIATLAGLGGAVLAPLLTRLTSRATAIASSVIVSFGAKMTMLLSTTEIIYSAAVIVWGFAFGLSLPLILGLAAVLKRDGSASVAVNGVYVLGVALGPIIATQLYGLGDEPLVAGVMGILGLLTAVAIILISVQIERRPSLAEAKSEVDAVNRVKVTS